MLFLVEIFYDVCELNIAVYWFIMMLFVFIASHDMFVRSFLYALAVDIIAAKTKESMMYELPCVDNLFFTSEVIDGFGRNVYTGIWL